MLPCAGVPAVSAISHAGGPTYHRPLSKLTYSKCELKNGEINSSVLTTTSLFFFLGGLQLFMTVPYAIGASVFTGGHQRHERFKTEPRLQRAPNALFFISASHTAGPAVAAPSPRPGAGAGAALQDGGGTGGPAWPGLSRRRRHACGPAAFRRSNRVEVK